MSAAANVLVGAVRLYQYGLRPVLGGQCIYHPCCSEYGIAALRGHGAGRGSLLAARRILRCNPWTAGGYDPVPEPRASAVESVAS